MEIEIGVENEKKTWFAFLFKKVKKKAVGQVYLISLTKQLFCFPHTGAYHIPSHGLLP